MSLIIEKLSARGIIVDSSDPIKKLLAQLKECDMVENPSYYQFYDEEDDKEEQEEETDEPYSETPCPKCGSHRVKFLDMQLRASDEGMNRLFTCKNRELIMHQDGRKTRCGHKWKV